MTQQQLGELLGFGAKAKTRVNSYVNGRQMPDVATLGRMLEALSCSWSNFGKLLDSELGLPQGIASDRAIADRAEIAIQDLLQRAAKAGAAQALGELAEVMNRASKVPDKE